MDASEHGAIGVGIIGLSASGGWASLAHVPALQAVPGFELRALSASSPESAAAAGRAHGVSRVYNDPSALASDPSVDLVVVAVKVSAHWDLVRPALAAGKMVMCEWPLGNGAEQSRELALLAAKAEVRTVVGLQARAAPAIRHLRDLIDGGFLGRVLSTTLTASGISWGDLTHPGKTYLLDRSEGASMLTIPVGHTLDALNMVLGPFADLQATTATVRPLVQMNKTDEVLRKTVADQIAVQGTLVNGAIVSVHFRGGTSRGTNFRWEINGTEGDIVVKGSEGGFLQYGQVCLRGGKGVDRELHPIATPPEYFKVPGLPEYGSHAFTVAHGYHVLREDILNDTYNGPDFQHAANLHAFLDRIEESDGSGNRLII